MGLGKTLSVLALICWSLDLSNLAKNGDQAEADAPPHATLVVAPKSSQQFHLSAHVFTTDMR